MQILAWRGCMHMCMLRGNSFTLALDWSGAGDWTEVDGGKSRVMWERGRFGSAYKTSRCPCTGNTL